jgi:hypothetical protein
VKLKILDLARDDLIQGFRFYEDKVAGLGDYFLSILFTDIERLKTTAGIHPTLYRSFHRSLSKRFPFAIYYTIKENTVYIRAIVDCRRDPSWIRRHLRRA